MIRLYSRNHLSGNIPRCGTPSSFPSLIRPVEQAASQASAAVLTSTEGMGGFSLPGAVRLFARAQIGMVSQAKLVLRLGRAMAIRFLEVMGKLSSRLSSARTLASPGSVANSTLVDARNSIEEAITQTLLPWA